MTDPLSQVEFLSHYIERSVAKDLVESKRRIRKLERKLRKAAGREKRLINYLFSRLGYIYITAKIRDARIEGPRYRHRNEICLCCYRPIRECGGVSGNCQN